MSKHEHANRVFASRIRNETAWQDWRDIAFKAHAAGLTDEQILANRPAKNAPYRQIEKAIGRLHEAIKAAEIQHDV